VHLGEHAIAVVVVDVRQRVALPGDRVGNRAPRPRRPLARERAPADVGGDEPPLTQVPIGAHRGQMVYGGELGHLPTA
jgi:hypothetical protein